MIVLGADAHERSHTIAAVSAATGELVGERTVQVGSKGFAALLVGARLMPVLADVGIDPGEPEIREIHNIIRR